MCKIALLDAIMEAIIKVFILDAQHLAKGANMVDFLLLDRNKSR